MLIWSGTQTVLLFGAGLVGSAVAAELTRLRRQRPVVHPFSWTEPEAGAAEIGRLKLRADRFDVVWSAGSGAFGAPAEVFEGELRAFRAVTGLALRLGGLPAFHLVSSAGGLFEGQRHVDAASRPKPLRPYGAAKLQQEETLLELPGLAARIYRPASLYGVPRPGVRAGLIATLLENARLNRVTTISGNAGTLRDYVLVDDAGRFIARQVHEGGALGEALLASARPSSIAEVLTATAAQIGRQPYVRYTTQRSNALDMSYRASALPPGWSPTDLRTGIAYVAGRQH